MVRSLNLKVEQFCECAPNFEKVKLVLEFRLIRATLFSFFVCYQLEYVSLIHLLPQNKINFEINISFNVSVCKICVDYKL